MSVTVTLANESQWEQLQPNNEMMALTRQRKPLFPGLEYVIKGLEPDCLYKASVRLERTDDRRFQHKKEGWTPLGQTDDHRMGLLPEKTKEIHHLLGGAVGEQWMRGKISFCFVRITPDPAMENENTFLVQTMHKYIPVLTITKYGDVVGQEFKLPQTEFMTVSGYKSERITKLKTVMNKYSRNDYKRGDFKRAHDEPVDVPAVKMPKLPDVPTVMSLLDHFQLEQIAFLAQLDHFRQFFAMLYEQQQNMAQGVLLANQGEQQSEEEDPNDEIVDVEN